MLRRINFVISYSLRKTIINLAKAPGKNSCKINIQREKERITDIAVINEKR